MYTSRIWEDNCIQLNCPVSLKMLHWKCNISEMAWWTCKEMQTSKSTYTPYELVLVHVWVHMHSCSEAHMCEHMEFLAHFWGSDGGQACDIIALPYVARASGARGTYGCWLGLQNHFSGGRAAVIQDQVLQYIKACRMREEITELIECHFDWFRCCIYTFVCWKSIDPLYPRQSCCSTVRMKCLYHFYGLSMKGMSEPRD
jgi:hypothetical protein